MENLVKLSDFLSELLANEWIVAEMMIELETKQPITGRIDLIVGNKDEVTLIDWKADSRQKNDNAPQLQLYAFLLASSASKTYKNNQFENIQIPDWVRSSSKKLVEVNLLHGDIIEHPWNDDYLYQVEDRVFKGVRKIRTLIDGRSPDEMLGEDFSVTDNPTNCKRCAFRQPCQAIQANTS